MRHETVEDARLDFGKELQCVGDRFMACLWEVRPDGRIRLYRTTSNFPREEFLNALKLLTEQLQADDGQPEPLPEYPFLTAGPSLPTQLGERHPNRSDLEGGNGEAGI